MDEMTEQDYKNILASIVRYVTTHGGSKEDARDVFHDAVEVACKRIAEGRPFQEGENMGGFIAQVARNKWVDITRRPNRRVLGEEHLPTDTESLSVPFDELLRQADEFGLNLTDIVTHDPNILRRYAVFLKWEDTECIKRLERKYIEGLKNTEQAALENVAENTFNQQMRRCRNGFVEMYNRFVKRR